jgi:hypothetical protein
MATKKKKVVAKVVEETAPVTKKQYRYLSKKTSGKNATGRPTKYSPALVKKTKEYIDLCVDTTDDIVTKKDHEMRPIAYESILKVKIPTIEGLSLYINISKSVLYLWRDEHKEFSDIIEELLAKQANMLVDNGLSGRYNSTIAKVLLSKHGYKEATEVDEKVTHKIDISKMLEKAYGDKEETE